MYYELEFTLILIKKWFLIEKVNIIYFTRAYLDEKKPKEHIKLIYNSDYYWEKVWKEIDKSEKYVMMVTYDMDNKMIANLTLKKLIEYEI